MTRPKLEIATIATLVVVGLWAVSVGVANGNAVLGSVGVGQWVAALGVWRRSSWGYLLAGLFGAVQVLLAGFVLVFSLGLAIPEQTGLDEPWLGLGFVTLNGYLTLTLLAALIVLSVGMMVAAWRGLRRTG